MWIWYYIILAISIILNFGLGITLLMLFRKYIKTAKQLYCYNVSSSGTHVD